MTGKEIIVVVISSQRSATCNDTCAAAQMTDPNWTSVINSESSAENLRAQIEKGYEIVQKVIVVKNSIKIGVRKAPGDHEYHREHIEVFKKKWMLSEKRRAEKRPST